MDVHKIFGRLKMGWVAPLVLVVIAVLYIFLNYSSWLTSSCIAPVGADIKFHVANVRSFVEQVKEYGLVYPVDYLQDVSGFYWYTRSPIPLIAPAFFALFFPVGAAFYLNYMILYVLVVLAFYVVVKSLTDEYIGFLFGLFFLFSNLSNMVFSVGGNYPFFFGLFFFFLSLRCIFLYAGSGRRKDLFLLALFAVGLGMTYLFSLIFLLSFMVAYGLFLKNWRLVKVALFVALASGVVFLPSLATSTSLLPSSGDFLSLGDLLDRYILPSTPFSWIYQSEVKYHGDLDFNQGVQVYVAGLAALAYLLHKRVKSRELQFILIHVLVMAGWVVLGLLSRFPVFGFLKGFFVSSLALERLMMHIALSFVLLLAYGLYKLNTRLQSFLLAAFSGFFLFGMYVVKTKLFFVLCGVALVFGIREVLKRKAVDWESMVISSLLLLLILFPLTGKVEVTNLMPREGLIEIDNLKSHLSGDDVFYFVGGWSIEQTIISCTGVPSIIQIDRDHVISGLKFESDVVGEPEKARKLLEQRGVTKLIVVVDQLLENNMLREDRLSGLVQWFGNPVKVETQAMDEGKKEPYYPFLVFSIPRVEREYELEKISPIKLKILNKKGLEDLLLNVEYHPWWGAVDAMSGEKIEMKNEHGFIALNGVSDNRGIFLKFSLRYFIIGLLFSVVGVFFLVKEIKNPRKIQKEVVHSQRRS